MFFHWISNALLQRTLQLLLVLVFQWGQPQHEAFPCAAALSRCRSSSPAIERGIFLAPTTAGVLPENHFRASPAARTAEDQYSATQRKNSMVVAARRQFLSCSTSVTPSEKTVFALKSRPLASTTATDETSSASEGTLAGPAETADPPRTTLRRDKSISPKPAIILRPTKNPSRGSCRRKSFCELLDSSEAASEKVQRATASGSHSVHYDLTGFKYLKENDFSAVHRLKRASKHPEIATGACGPLRGVGRVLPSASAAPTTTIRTSGRKGLPSFPALILSYGLSSVVDIRTARLRGLSLSSTSPHYLNKEVLGAFSLWKKTSPFLAAVLSPALTRQSVDQQQRRSIGEVLQLLPHAGKKEKSKLSINSGGCFESIDRTNLLQGAAVPVAPLIRCSRCPAAATICRTSSLECVSVAPTPTVPSHGSDSSTVEKSSGRATIGPLLAQTSDIGPFTESSKNHPRRIVRSTTTGTLQAPIKQRADCATTSTLAAAGETPQAPVTGRREAGLVLSRSAASAALRAYMRLMLSLTSACQTARKAGTRLKVCNPTGAPAGNETRALAANVEKRPKNTAAATSLLYTLSHAAFLGAQLPQRRGECGRTIQATEAAEDGEALTLGLQSCDRKQNSSSNSAEHGDDDTTEETHVVCKQMDLRIAHARKVMKNSLAWLFWRKKEKQEDEDTQSQKRDGDNRKTGPASGASEREVIFTTDQEKDLFDKDSEEARRQAFRSPVVSAIHRFWDETPKFTRFYLTGAFTLSLLSLLYGQSYPGILSPNALLFDCGAIREKKQFHRLVTSLFYFGPLSLPTLLSLSFVHAYLGGLEQHFQRRTQASSASSTFSPDRSHPTYSRRLSFRHRLLSFFLPFSPRHMFPCLVLSSAAAAMTLAALKRIPNEHLLQCMSTSLLHVWSRLFPSGEADFYGLFTISNELLPFFFLAQNWVLEGRIVAADLYGIGIAALWLLLAQQKLEEQQQQNEGSSGEQPPRQPRT